MADGLTGWQSVALGLGSALFRFSSHPAHAFHAVNDVPAHGGDTVCPMKGLPQSTLYDSLSEPTPLGPTSGRTDITKAKETIDNDVERFAVEDLVSGN